MTLLLALYAVILIVIVILGAQVNRWIVLNHRRMQFIMSFVAGIMLGIAVFHLLPHAIYASSFSNTSKMGAVSIDWIAGSLMLGLLSMFLLQRIFHFHQHDFDEAQTHRIQAQIKGEKATSGLEARSFGVIIGLAIHSMMDGIALASTIQAESLYSDNGAFALLGMGVFIAICLHKPLDAMTISIFISGSEKAQRWRYPLLIGYAVICPIVAGFILAGFATDMLSSSLIAGALGFSAGIFLCIALSDLLPEIHFHDHDRFKMTVLLLLGISLSLLIKQFEAPHLHHGHMHNSHDTYNKLH